ncbi:MAG TPA: hypothetical protein VGO21_02375 [Candidatus Paceibacterota bacterium]|jgi:hypothetical protein|nr:hypothetical protein [Candidatus Paceibacterota bacterium]
MKKFLFIAIAFLGIYTASAQSAHAANISLITSASAHVGENISVAITADTGGILINSIEAVVSYDKNLLSFSGYSDDNDVIKIWIEPPHEEEGLPAQTGKIYFSGIIPGGVMGLYDAKKKELSPIPLVHLFFTPKKLGTSKFSFISSKILEHDGLGTPLPHEEKGAEVLINNSPNTTGENTKAGTEANDVPNPPDPQNSSSSFSVIIFLVVLVSGVLVYKLLKYKA